METLVNGDSGPRSLARGLQIALTRSEDGLKAVSFVHKWDRYVESFHIVATNGRKIDEG